MVKNSDGPCDNIKEALNSLSNSMSETIKDEIISFEEYLNLLVENPSKVMRNVFLIFHDMVKSYVREGVDEYPDDPESIKFINYDFTNLFVKESDHPFFSYRLFGNRFMSHVESLKHGSQQNTIYIFEGPHGCGKSTFLNNLLKKFEEYARSEEGIRYEIIWRIDVKLINAMSRNNTFPALERLIQLIEKPTMEQAELFDKQINTSKDGKYIEIPCACHDNPILMIPKKERRDFFDKIIKNDEFKWKLFTNKEYDWVFRNSTCTICNCLYNALIQKVKSPKKIFEMLYARPYKVNRLLSEGICVFNPGDRPVKSNVMTNPILQRKIDTLFEDSNQVKYLYSQFAKTNNGIYALMDIKSHNVERLVELHNIVSEGVHKVDDIEENVDSLFIALMNPEDKNNIKDIPSFSDRVLFINIPYILDMKTEVEIYKNIFGKQIANRFLPRILNNFARVIISTRLLKRSTALLEWIGNPEKYSLYCDHNLQLLKMEIYSGKIPTWLAEEDRNKLTAKRRRKIIAESNIEGEKGLSGRDSIKIFDEFFSLHAKSDKMIDMSMLSTFFTKTRKDLHDLLPEKFLNSLIQMYNYSVLQEVKESLYYYNVEQISRDIKNYLFAINFETESVETCTYTGDKLNINQELLKSFEDKILGKNVFKENRTAFRKDTQKEYTSITLTQEIIVQEKDISETTLFETFLERYEHNIKEKVLDPFLENENFRRAIKDYDTEDFKTYDKKIKNDVGFLINNLMSKFSYTEQGAKEVCIYVIDNNLAKKFSKP